MNRTSFVSASALAALLAAAPVAFAQSGAQTGAMGSGGSTSSQTGTNQSNPVGPGGSLTANSPSSMQTAPSAPGGQTATQQGANSAQYGNMGANAGNAAADNGQADNGQTQQFSQETVENVQQHLQQQGFYKSAKVDGKWGPHTRQAVQSFQQAKGLPATGQLDQQTLGALGVNGQGG